MSAKFPLDDGLRWMDSHLIPFHHTLFILTKFPLFTDFTAPLPLLRIPRCLPISQPSTPFQLSLSQFKSNMIVMMYPGTNLSRLYEFTTFAISPLRKFQEQTTLLSERLIDLVACIIYSSPGLIAFAQISVLHRK